MNSEEIASFIKEKEEFGRIVDKQQKDYVMFNKNCFFCQPKGKGHSRKF